MGLGTVVRALIFGKEADHKRRSAKAARIRSPPDRRVMADSYVPALAADGGRILWVGCREYTLDDYAALEAHGGAVWTTDIDAAAERWGREGRHHTGDVCEADRLFSDMTFDAIVCNGVLGYGVDSPEQQRKALGRSDDLGFPNWRASDSTLLFGGVDGRRSSSGRSVGAD